MALNQNQLLEVQRKIMPTFNRVKQNPKSYRNGDSLIRNLVLDIKDPITNRPYNLSLSYNWRNPWTMNSIRTNIPKKINDNEYVIYGDGSYFIVANLLGNNIMAQLNDFDNGPYDRIR
jgi:hypothetical protein